MVPCSGCSLRRRRPTRGCACCRHPTGRARPGNDAGSVGGNVVTPGEARRAVESYAETLREMAASRLDPNISVKLTMLGLDIADDVAYDNMLTLLETARSVEGFVRIDMEGSAYTERTLAVAEALHARFPGLVGTVIQAYLHRSDRDVERLIGLKMRVRLVKGAYAEPAS